MNTRMSNAPIFAVALALAYLAGCDSTTLRLSASPMVPAAQGTVRVSSGKNGNTRLQIEVEHLAKPEAVADDAKVYLAWVSTGEGTPQSIGELKVSRALAGNLETLTPARYFDLMITAEASAAVRSPQGPKVLSTRVSR